jgi:CBS-domain-containing membrane protein
MRARDIMQAARVVRPDAPCEELLRVFEDPEVRAAAILPTREGDRAGLVTEEDVLSALLPSYVLEDEALAAVLEETAAERMRGKVASRKVREVINVDRRRYPPVDPDDTLIEVAAAMARSGHPAVLVAGKDGRVVGVITADALLPAFLGSSRR